jgi:hypothetical protein
MMARLLKILHPARRLFSPPFTMFMKDAGRACWPTGSPMDPQPPHHRRKPGRSRSVCAPQGRASPQVVGSRQWNRHHGVRAQSRAPRLTCRDGDGCRRRVYLAHCRAHRARPRTIRICLRAFARVTQTVPRRGYGLAGEGAADAPLRFNCVGRRVGLARARPLARSITAGSSGRSRPARRMRERLASGHRSRRRAPGSAGQQEDSRPVFPRQRSQAAMD